MKKIKLLFLFIILLLSTAEFSHLKASTEKVQAYFNQDNSFSYTDRYRNIKRKGSDLEAVIVSEILKAKSSVYVAIQELRLPLIAQALVEQKKNGLDVRVILENNYNNTILTIKDPNTEDPNGHESSRFTEFFTLVDVNGDGEISKVEMGKRDAIYILEKSKVKVKDDTFDRSNGSGLMHHKFIVIDGKKVIVSSANFTMSGIHGDFLDTESRGNSNSLITLSSVNLAKFYGTEFLHMWGGLSGRKNSLFGSSKPFRGPQRTTISKHEVLVQFSPTSKSFDWEKSVNGLIGKEIKQSKHSINMALFVFSDQRLANILKEKSEKKVDYEIGLFVEPKFAYRSYSEMLDLWGIELMDENCTYELGNSPWDIPLFHTGVPKLKRGDMLHHKFAVIDETTVIMGSQNWSDAANFINDENVLVIRNKKIAEQYLKEFSRLSKDSRQGPSKSLLKRIQILEEACALENSGVYFSSKSLFF